MLAAAILAITFNPALRLLLVPRHDCSESESSWWRRCSNWLLGGPIRPLEDNPITGPLDPSFWSSWCIPQSMRCGGSGRSNTLPQHWRKKELRSKVVALVKPSPTVFARCRPKLLSSPYVLSAKLTFPHSCRT